MWILVLYSKYKTHYNNAENLVLQKFISLAFISNKNIRFPKLVKKSNIKKI